jgi:hypothetical protein
MNKPTAQNRKPKSRPMYPIYDKGVAYRGMVFRKEMTTDPF